MWPIHSLTAAAHVLNEFLFCAIVVGAGIASEGGAGVVAACAKKPPNEPNHMERSQ
jgi:hypothetical protein